MWKFPNNIGHELWATKRKYLDFYDFLEWRRRWPRFLCGLTLFQTGKRDYFNFTAVSLIPSSVTATGNVFMKIRLHIFSQLPGSPRVIWGQTVNLPGVFLCNMTWNPKWHVTSVKWGLFFSWLTSLVCLLEPRTGCWHPPFILSAFQTFPFHDHLREQRISRTTSFFCCGYARSCTNAALFLRWGHCVR